MCLLLLQAEEARRLKEQEEATARQAEKTRKELEAKRRVDRLDHQVSLSQFMYTVQQGMWIGLCTPLRSANLCSYRGWGCWWHQC